MMRDPARIKPFLEKFEELWNTKPDMRFMQLIHTLLPKGNDGFYIEDDKILDLINVKCEIHKEAEILFNDFLSKNNITTN